MGTDQSKKKPPEKIKEFNVDDIGQRDLDIDENANEDCNQLEPPGFIMSGLPGEVVPDDLMSNDSVQSTDHRERDYAAENRKKKIELDTSKLYKRKVTHDLYDNRRNFTKDEPDRGSEKHEILSNIIFLPDKSKGAAPKRYGPRRLGYRPKDLDENSDTIESDDDDDDRKKTPVSSESDLSDTGISITAKQFNRSDSMKVLCDQTISEFEKAVEPENERDLDTVIPPPDGLSFVEDHFGLYTGTIACGGAPYNPQTDQNNSTYNPQNVQNNAPGWPSSNQLNHQQQTGRQVDRQTNYPNMTNTHNSPQLPYQPTLNPTSQPAQNSYPRKPENNIELHDRTSPYPRQNHQRENNLTGLANTNIDSPEINNKTYPVQGEWNGTRYSSPPPLFAKPEETFSKTSEHPEHTMQKEQQPDELEPELNEDIELCQCCKSPSGECSCLNIFSISRSTVVPTKALVRYNEIGGVEVPWSDLKSDQACFAKELKSIKTNLPGDNRLEFKFEFSKATRHRNVSTTENLKDSKSFKTDFSKDVRIRFKSDLCKETEHESVCSSVEVNDYHGNTNASFLESEPVCLDSNDCEDAKASQRSRSSSVSLLGVNFVNTLSESDEEKDGNGSESVYYVCPSVWGTEYDKSIHIINCVKLNLAYFPPNSEKCSFNTGKNFSHFANNSLICKAEICNEDIFSIGFNSRETDSTFESSEHIEVESLDNAVSSPEQLEVGILPKSKDKSEENSTDSTEAIENGLDNLEDVDGDIQYENEIVNGDFDSVDEEDNETCSNDLPFDTDTENENDELDENSETSDDPKATIDRTDYKYRDEDYINRKGHIIDNRFPTYKTQFIKQTDGSNLDVLPEYNGFPSHCNVDYKTNVIKGINGLNCPFSPVNCEKALKQAEMMDDIKENMTDMDKVIEQVCENDKITNTTDQKNNLKNMEQDMEQNDGTKRLTSATDSASEETIGKMADSIEQHPEDFDKAVTIPDGTKSNTEKESKKTD